MTANQYRAALDKLGLTQVGAARLLDVNEATSRRWARYGVTGTAAIVLRLLATGKITVKDIKAAHDR
jgi:hypothetical protein